MKKRLAIVGNTNRGNEIITIFKALFKVNICHVSCNNPNFIYFVDNIGPTTYIGAHKNQDRFKDEFVIFTLDELCRNFTYAIGDKIRLKEQNEMGTVVSAFWDEDLGEIAYQVKTEQHGMFVGANVDNIELCIKNTEAEKDSEHLYIDIPEGYAFNDIKGNKIVLVKKENSKHKDFYYRLVEIREEIDDILTKMF